MSNWLRRCPYGHSNLVGRSGDCYACRSCGTTYRGDPLDARQHEFPVDDADKHLRQDPPHRRTVLAELVELDQRKDTIKASDLSGGKPQALASKLVRLRDEGLVEDEEWSTGNAWAPTDAGRRAVYGGEA